MAIEIIRSVEDLIKRVKLDRKNWTRKETFPWFRGEPNEEKTQLTPLLYRTEDGWQAENRLLQQFRMRAPTLGLLDTPPRNHTDQWLFLARHVGLPTRLLDWTESLLVALHFAIYDKKSKKVAVVWMLDPVGLNKIAKKSGERKKKRPKVDIPRIKDNAYPLTWFSPERGAPSKGEIASNARKNEKYTQGRVEQYVCALRGFPSPTPNFGNLNVRGAWESDKPGKDVPIAIHPTHIHPRFSAQRSCFTVHGIDKRSLYKIAPQVLWRYEIDMDEQENIKKDLRLLGITHASINPDLDGLAMELKEIFFEITEHTQQVVD